MEAVGGRTGVRGGGRSERTMMNGHAGRYEVSRVGLVAGAGGIDGVKGRINRGWGVGRGRGSAGSMIIGNG